MTKTLAERYVEAIIKGNVGLSARLEDELEAEGRAEHARLNAPDALIKAAVYYARRGIAVFPCTPRDKTPHGGLVPRVGDTPGGLHRATTDVDQIIEWWTAEPSANIGAPTGLKFDVVDIDGREGVLAVYGEGRELPDEIGHASTPRMAGHHIFIEPTGRGNTTKMLPGVDFRGKGGYVLLAPSVGANGNRYRWSQPLNFLA